MKSEVYYRVRADIIVTSNKENMEDQIIGEINVLCHKLEQLDGTTHIYLSRQDVICESEI